MNEKHIHREKKRAFSAFLRDGSRLIYMLMIKFIVVKQSMGG